MERRRREENPTGLYLGLTRIISLIDSCIMITFKHEIECDRFVLNTPTSPIIKGCACLYNKGIVTPPPKPSPPPIFPNIFLIVFSRNFFFIYVVISHWGREKSWHGAILKGVCRPLLSTVPVHIKRIHQQLLLAWMTNASPVQTNVILSSIYNLSVSINQRIWTSRELRVRYIDINIFLYASDELGVKGSRGELGFISVTHKAIVRNIDETQRESGEAVWSPS